MNDVEVVELAGWLLEEQPGWPQPADPFDGLPPAGRATCDGDRLPCQ